MKFLKQKSLIKFLNQQLTTPQQTKVKGGTDGDGEIVIEDAINN